MSETGGKLIEGMFPVGETQIAPAPKTGYCTHVEHGYTVDSATRTVRCTACEKVLDPFDILLAYANEERQYRDRRRERVRAERETIALREEAKALRVKMRGYSRKDAEKAVADERRRAAEAHDRARWAAHEIEHLAAKIQRHLSMRAVPDTAPTQTEESSDGR